MAETNGFLRNFPDLPAFPDDVPQVPLLRLSLQKLIDNDSTELDRLWKACTGVGFFYLDLRHVGPHPDNHSGAPALDGETFLSDATKLFDISDTVFDLPVTEKVKYDFRDQGSYFGYKGFGVGLVDATGTKDRNEFYNVSRWSELLVGLLTVISPCLDLQR